MSTTVWSPLTQQLYPTASRWIVQLYAVGARKIEQQYGPFPRAAAEAVLDGFRKQFPDRTVALEEAE